MKNALALITIFLVIGGLAYSQSLQTLKGKVVEKTNKGVEPLFGATVSWAGTTKGTTTNENGEFDLQKDSIKNILVISYVGYISDTIKINDQTFINVTLKGTKTLKEVTVKGNRRDVFVSEVNPIKTEVITQAELTKDACCDLAGCFNTNASVQATTTNVLTNSQELRILGLSGVYNQVLVDGMPLINGLSYTYGISSIPGTLVDNIYVSKGANSVLQGFEGMSGQINVILKEPDVTERFLFNAYANNFLEKQFNLNYSLRKNNWSNLTALHVVLPANKTDRNGDAFLDLPLINRYVIYNKVKYRSDDSLGLSGMFALKFINEKRLGGQEMFNESLKGDSLIYGQSTIINQPEAYTKIKYRFNDDKAISLSSSGYFHNQSSWFGETNYEAAQKNFYSNLQYELRWKEKHEFIAGGSLRLQDIQENISFSRNLLSKSYAGRYIKQETIAGVFAENTFKWYEDKVMLITGVRFDNHNTFGNYYTPRGLIKYEINEQNNIRVSLGRGWRTINLFSENINLLASQRNVIITEQLKPEESINYGINFTKNIEKNNVSGSFGIDFYRTQFQNQIFPDYDTDPAKAFISNFRGTSISNGFQVESSLKFYNEFSVKLAYNYLNVYRSINNIKQTIPFNSKHKILSTLSYKPESEKWHFDTNIHWYGEQNLPNTKGSPAAFQRPDKSLPYTLVNGQFTRSWKNFDVYLGCENIFDFRQKDPIISAENPFGQYFDISSVWGPTRGREFYGGLRYKINYE